jgi:hypothetical protein
VAKKARENKRSMDRFLRVRGKYYYDAVFLFLFKRYIEKYLHMDKHL